MNITKRDGSVEEFNINKIYNALNNSFKATYDVVDNTQIDNVIKYLKENFNNKLTNVESIQDCVEDSLMKCGFHDVAKNYILYRKKRENIRASKSKMDKVFHEILKSDKSDLLRENANLNSNSPMGLMLLFGSEFEKDYVLRNLVSPKYAQMHTDGYIHIHDLNFYACTFNCCHIDLETLFKNGFDTGDGHIRRPNSIQSATSLSAIIIQSNQNDMFGGQGIPMFEYNLAPYVAISFAKRLRECLEILLGVDNLVKIEYICKDIYNENGSLLDNLDKVKWFVNYHFDTEDKTSRIVDKALSLTDRDTYQAMEGFIHNMNSLHSRAGAQTPFSSINYGTGTTAECRMIIKNVLKATEAGLGNHETPIFPIQIFKIKEGVNALPGDPNYDLYQYACKVTPKRFYPNYTNIDTPSNIQYYRKGKPETEMATMGAVSEDCHLYVKINNGVPVDITIKSLFDFCKTGVLAESRPCDIFFNKERVLLKGDRTVQKKSGITPGAGVYSITYIPEDVSYIGGSSDVNRRLTEHRCSIRLTGGISAGACFGDTNLDNYKFKVLEYTNDYKDREKFYIQNSKNVNYKGTSQRYYKQCGGSKRLYERPKFKQNLDIKQDLVDTSELDIMVLDRDMKWVKMNHIFKNDHRNTPRMMFIYYKEFDKEYCLKCTEDHPLYVGGNKFVRADSLKVGDKIYRADNLELTITDISWCWESVDSYDIGTVTGSFIGSDIIMHNCRTRVIGQLNTEEGSVKNRGNIAFTTINLPRIALETKNIDKFFSRFDEIIDDCIDELLERVNFISKKKVYNFPFLMGQNLYMGSENLDWNDDIEPALKNGTLSVGFCGLAECLKCLTGKHHGESDVSYDLGVAIISYLREKTDKATEKYGWYFSTFATPAESTAGKFLKLDRKKFGIVEGVTDRDYYTNSFHIPVYYKITAFEKMKKEGLFHELCNAGAITYIELDGDAVKNSSVVQKLVDYSRKCGISYFSINTIHDVCPVCGYDGIINTNKCPSCGWIEGTEVEYKM